MSTEGSFALLSAATGQPVGLALQRLWLTGQVLPAGARMIVQHVFQSREQQALEVIYCFPLPRDAALKSFRITGENFEAHSELKDSREAVATYEKGIAQGALSTLARQYGDGLINLTVGNIRPGETVTVHLEILCGVELRDDGFRFRFPFTLAPAFHFLAKTALTSAGEGEIELPAAEFGDLFLPRFCADASALHQVGFEVTVNSPLALAQIASPSHGVRMTQIDSHSSRVALATEKDIPDRDLVLDVAYRSVEPQVLAGHSKSGQIRFAAIVPSSSFGVLKEDARRVVILLDRSSSMQGAPLTQACKAIEACLGALSDRDWFGIVAFGDRPTLFQSALTVGTRKCRDKAHRFLQTVSAEGGTHLANGFLAAAEMLGDRGGDIFILTDGQVFGTAEILSRARSLGIRLHCLGIGSASQDRFLALLARETGGVSRFVTPRERVDIPAVDLFASIGRPIASGLKAGANIQPDPPSAVFRGTPVLLFGEGAEAAGAAIELTWADGRLRLPIRPNDSNLADTIGLLQGARLITDWESRYPSTASHASLDQRKENRVAARLFELSQTYGLASRAMSLVAVVTRRGDRVGDLPETRVVPLGMARDTPFSAYFSPSRARVGSKKEHDTDSGVLFRGIYGSPAPDVTLFFSRFDAQPATDDPLVALASRLESDGGMPGGNSSSRAAASLIAFLAFFSHGHTATQGAFRSHVARLLSYLKSLTGLGGRRQNTVAAVLEMAANGAAPPGDWVKLAQTSGEHWSELEKACKPRSSWFAGFK